MSFKPNKPGKSGRHDRADHHHAYRGKPFDIQHGGRHDDDLTGGPGNSYVFGGAGDDRLDGGLGRDRVFGGSGDDLLLFTMEEARCGRAEFYNGGGGFDTLQLNLTAAQWSTPEVKADVLALLDWIEAGSHGVLRLPALNLKLVSIEALTVQVDGVVIDPLGDDDPEIAVADDAFTTTENAPLTGDVSLNDTIATGATFALATTPANGTLVFNPDGSFSFDPGADFDSLAEGQTATESFTYTLSLNGTALTATATITITGTNDTPTVAAAITASANEDDASFDLDLLAGASDIDTGAVLAIANVSPLPAGVSLAGTTLTVNPADAAFQPLNLGQTAELVVTFDVVDEHGASVPQSATITITGTNDAPTVAAAITASANEDDASFDLDLLAGAADIDTGAVLAIANVSPLPAGVTLAGTTLTVDPADAAFQPLNLGQTAELVVTFDVVDEHGASVPQSATITVTGTNDAPTVAGTLTATTDEDAAPLTVDLLANASDIDLGHTLSVSGLVQTSGVAVPASLSGAELTLDASALQYLALGESTVLSFNYTVTDEHGAGVPATLEVTVEGRNDAPIVVGSLATVYSELGVPETIDTSALFFDIDASDTLSYSATLVGGDPLPAWLSIDPATGALSGTPVNAQVLYQIEVTAEDPHGETATTTFWLVEGANYLIGTPDPDSLIGSGNVPHVILGLGSGDTLQGGDGSDLYALRAGEGMDVIEENGLGDTDVIFLDGVAPGDALFSRFEPGSDDLLITVGGEALALVRNTLSQNAADQIEQIVLADGTTLDMTAIRAMILAQEQGSGAERAIGWAQAETLGGTAGDDFLAGGDQSDLYLYAAGDGNDTVRDGGFADTDRIEISGWASTDAVFSQDPADLTTLLITFPNGEVLTVANTLNGASNNQIEQIYFAGDGVTLTPAELRERLIDAQQTSGDDVVIGFGASDDTLEGGLGNDFLQGGDRSDTYVFNIGDGQDRVLDAGFADTDVLSFLGRVAAEASYSRSAENPNDLIISFANGDSVTVLSTLPLDSTNAIELVYFDDATVSIGTIRDLVLAAEAATPGHDELFGWGGPNVLLGGLESDFLSGGDNSDLYDFTGALGTIDAIIDDRGFADTDRIDLSTFASTDVTFHWLDAESGVNTLVLRTTGGDQILVRDINSNAGGIEEFVFSDVTLTKADAQAAATLNTYLGVDVAGTTGDDTLSANPGALGAGQHTLLRGLNGSDSYEFDIGDGLVYIEDDGSADNDSLNFTGYAFADASFTRLLGTDNGLVISFAGGDEVIIRMTLDENFIQEIETINFTDVTGLTMADIRDLLISQQITAGDDTVLGMDHSQTMTGGLGDDVLIGANGGDVYLYAAGDGADIIEDQGNGAGDSLTITGYDLSDATLSFAYGTNDITFDFGGGDSLTLRDSLTDGFFNGIETVTFDGTSLTAYTMEDFRAIRLAQMQTGGDDTVLGSASAETLEGGLGDDFLSGLNGGDTYVYTAGDGDDVIRDNGAGSGDVLEINGIDPTDVTLTRSLANNSDVTLSFTGGGSVTLRNTLSDNFIDAIETITFTADGTSWSMADLREMVLAGEATAGDDDLRGWSTADTLEAGAGSDWLYGYQGGDTYVFNFGDGDDFVHDQGGGAGDSLVFLGRDIADASFSAVAPGDPDLLITFANGDSVTVVNGVLGGFTDGIEDFVFDDGTLAFADVLALL